MDISITQCMQEWGFGRMGEGENYDTVECTSSEVTCTHADSRPFVDWTRCTAMMWRSVVADVARCG
jgi:hypothetical protein